MAARIEEAIWFGHGGKLSLKSLNFGASSVWKMAQRLSDSEPPDPVQGASPGPLILIVLFVFYSPVSLLAFWIPLIINLSWVETLLGVHYRLCCVFALIYPFGKSWFHPYSILCVGLERYQTRHPISNIQLYWPLAIPIPILLCSIAMYWFCFKAKYVQHYTMWNLKAVWWWCIACTLPPPPLSLLSSADNSRITWLSCEWCWLLSDRYHIGCHNEKNTTQ